MPCNLRVIKFPQRHLETSWVWVLGVYGKLLYIRGTSDLIASHIAKGLGRYWNVCGILNPFHIPISLKAYYLLRTFNPNRWVWSSQYHYESFSYYKRIRSFVKRSRWVDQQLDQLKNDVDAVFQTGAYCLPQMRKLEVPYFVYIDYTTILADRTYALWARFRSDREKLEWIQVEREVYDRADRVFTFHEGARSSVITDYDIAPEKVIKVGAGVILGDVPQPECVDDSKTILFAGRDFARHGGELVLQALQLVQRAIPEATLVIAGSRLNTNNSSVKYLGSVSHSDLQNLYRQARVLVLPGKVGGFQTVTEAMAHGCVCITAAGNPYFDDVILDGKTGYAVDDSPRQIAERMLMVLRNQDLQHQIGKQAAEHIAQHFTWPRVMARISQEMATLL